MLNFCDFIQVYVFTTNQHLNQKFTHSLDFGLKVSSISGYKCLQFDQLLH